MERPVSMMARRSPTPSTIISESTVQSLKRHTESLKLVTQKRDSGTKRKRQVKAYFCEERHKSNATPETNRTKVAHWRMKERVRIARSRPLLLVLLDSLTRRWGTDEDRERGAGIGVEHWRRSTRRLEAIAVCANGVLDRCAAALGRSCQGPRASRQAAAGPSTLTPFTHSLAGSLAR